MQLTYATFAVFTAFAHLTKAVNIFVTSYDGNVTTLSLTTKSENDYTLTQIAQNQDCGSSPSWLVRDQPSNTVYCLDENFAADPTNPKSIFAAFASDQTGLQLKGAINLTTYASVSGAISPDRKSMAIAGYAGQVTVVSLDGEFKQTQILNYVNNTVLPPADQASDSQKGPHPHQALQDPTGQYVIVPDLGGDLLRVFAWTGEEGSQTLAEKKSFKMDQFAGPRHAAFFQPNPQSIDELYLFVVTELTNMVYSYKVDYQSGLEGGLGFTLVQSLNTFGKENVPNGAAAAEIQISPDQKYIIVSNRKDSSFSISQYGAPADTTQTEYSDSLATFTIKEGGDFSFKSIAPSGGKIPRHFSINKAGDMVAVANQESCRVVILSRWTECGTIGRSIADISLGTCPGAGPNNVVWDE